MMTTERQNCDLAPDVVARMIDHTLLAPESSAADVRRLCAEAFQYGFFAVCVNPCWVSLAAELLSAPSPRAPDRPDTPSPIVASVVGFPLGANTTEVKATEAARAIEDGAREVDMVLPLGALCCGDWATVRREIQAVASVVHQMPGALLKVILETAALTESQTVQGCRCAAEGEADFVKTSTGFHPGGGATVEHVRLLYRHASPIRVKASGGIRTVEALSAMVGAGACRVGTSSGVALMEALRSRDARTS